MPPPLGLGWPSGGQPRPPEARFASSRGEKNADAGRVPWHKWLQREVKRKAPGDLLRGQKGLSTSFKVALPAEDGSKEGSTGRSAHPWNAWKVV